MTINATAVWRVRAGGSADNGGGYDAAISGAATDYSDQDAAQLTITDGATSGAGVTTLTSAAAGFTSAMVGNCIRISAGTNFQTGYYFITAFGSTSSVTLDRTPTSGGAGSGGTGKVGGAFAKINQFANGGSGTQPTLTTPLVPGNIIYVRGAGTNDPSVADYNQDDGHLTFPAGDTTGGRIKMIGYNGRPMFTTSNLLLLQNLSVWSVSNIKIIATGATFATFGFISTTGSSGICVDNCIFDQNGNDCIGISGISEVTGCWFKNTGGGGIGNNAAINAATNQNRIQWTGNVVNGWLGPGMNIPAANADSGSIRGNLVVNGLSNGIVLNGNDISQGVAIISNTIYNNAGAGLLIKSVSSIGSTLISDNIFSTNGAYGINCDAGTTALNDRLFPSTPDYNDFYNNVTGPVRNMSNGPNDQFLDPQFTNAAGGDFSIGTNLRAKGFPGTFPNGTTTGYTDTGAVQRQETSGGAATTLMGQACL